MPCHSDLPSPQGSSSDSICYTAVRIPSDVGRDGKGAVETACKEAPTVVETEISIQQKELRSVRTDFHIVSQQDESRIFSLSPQSFGALHSPQTFGALFEVWTCSKVWDTLNEWSVTKEVGVVKEARRMFSSQDLSQGSGGSNQTCAAAASPSLSALKPSALFSKPLAFSPSEALFSAPPSLCPDDETASYATGAAALKSPVALLFRVARDTSNGRESMQRTNHAPTTFCSVRNEDDHKSPQDFTNKPFADRGVNKSFADRGLKVVHQSSRMAEEIMNQGALDLIHVPRGEEWLVLPSSLNIDMSRLGTNNVQNQASESAPIRHSPELHSNCNPAAPCVGSKLEGQRLGRAGDHGSDAFSERRSRSPLEEGRRRAEVARENAVSTVVFAYCIALQVNALCLRPSLSNQLFTFSLIMESEILKMYVRLREMTV